MTQVLIKNFLKPPKERSASTRPQGKRVRQFMSKNWADVERYTVVFEKGLRATISFMDEAFAKLLDDHPLDDFFEKVRFQNLSAYNQELLFRTLRNRAAHSVVSKERRDEEERNALMKAISDLQPSDRNLIMLYYYDGLSFEKIARLTGKSPNAIRVRFARLRKHLREILISNGYQINLKDVMKSMR